MAGGSWVLRVGHGVLGVLLARGHVVVGSAAQRVTVVRLASKHECTQAGDRDTRMWLMLVSVRSRASSTTVMVMALWRFTCEIA